MAEAYVCWKCGVEQAELLLPLARLTECPSCRAQLHVCRMCRYFDPAAAQQCREPVADTVADKQRANFCGYFQIRPRAFVAVADSSEESRRRLEGLFGSGSNAALQVDGDSGKLARKKLEEMFKK